MDLTTLVSRFRRIAERECSACAVDRDATRRLLTLIAGLTQLEAQSALVHLMGQLPMSDVYAAALAGKRTAGDVSGCEDER